MDKEPRRDRHDLDDAIDRVVRDMTRAEANDAAVARVMARVRGARVPDENVGGSWMWSPRAAWSLAAAAALVLVVIIAGYWRPANVRGGGDVTRREVARATPTVPTPQAPPSSPSGEAAPHEATVVRQEPALASAAPHRVRKPANAADTTMRATSIVEAAAVERASVEADDEFHSDLSPREGDLAMSSIAPVPLAESPALTVAPLGMRELAVDSIDPSPITVPSAIGPQR